MSDTPAGDDSTLRPNQILAVSLPASPLPTARQQAVVEAVASRLLTSYGLRSLSPSIRSTRDATAAISGRATAPTTRAPCGRGCWARSALAHFRVYRDVEAARSFLLPLADHLGEHGVGSVAEIFDGDPPFRPAGCVAQAWSVAETLRAWHHLARGRGGMLQK
jgi:glycogen debranching enzyme